MTSAEIADALEGALGFEPEDANIMVEGRSDHARLSLSFKAAATILEMLGRLGTTI